MGYAGEKMVMPAKRTIDAAFGRLAEVGGCKRGWMVMPSYTGMSHQG